MTRAEVLQTEEIKKLVCVHCFWILSINAGGLKRTPTLLHPCSNRDIHVLQLYDGRPLASNIYGIGWFGAFISIWNGPGQNAHGIPSVHEDSVNPGSRNIS